MARAFGTVACQLGSTRIRRYECVRIAVALEAINADLEHDPKGAFWPGRCYVRPAWTRAVLTVQCVLTVSVLARGLSVAGRRSH
jgi:hypothetical protein